MLQPIYYPTSLPKVWGQRGHPGTRNYADSFHMPQ